jgi:hypothetical protein
MLPIPDFLILMSPLILLEQAHYRRGRKRSGVFQVERRCRRICGLSRLIAIKCS